MSCSAWYALAAAAILVAAVPALSGAALLAALAGLLAALLAVSARAPTARPLAVWLASLAAVYLIARSGQLALMTGFAMIPLTLSPQFRQFLRPDLAACRLPGTRALVPTILIIVAVVITMQRWFDNVLGSSYRMVDMTTGVPAFAIDALDHTTGRLPLIVAASIFNAVTEELLWRSALPRQLVAIAPAAHRRGAVVVAAGAIQAASFGIAHLNGVPWGVSGAALTGLFGAAAYALTIHTRSLLPAITAHIAADVVIGIRLV